jgi:hypothetical protein
MPVTCYSRFPAIACALVGVMRDASLALTFAGFASSRIK